MPKLKQGTAVIALVASLGLIMPGSFRDPASADVSRKKGIQPMDIECDLDGNGSLEFVSDVVAVDHDPSGNMATLQDTQSSLVFHPQSGNVETVYAAIDHPFDAETDLQDITPLADDDARLAGGYPAVFTIPPGHPYSILGEDGFSRGGTAKKGLVDCVVTDIGASDDGSQNWYPAGEFEDGVTDCLVDGEEQELCFVPPVLDDEGEFVSAVVYHYTDTFTITADVSNGGGAKAKSASVDDDDASAERQAKTKKGEKQRGKGKRR